MYGNTIANIRIKLTDEKFITHTLENGEQENTYSVSVTIIPKKLSKPVATNKNYVYNGNLQEFELINFDNTKMNIKNNTRTEAGEQTVTVTLKNTNYIWEDSTNNALTFNFKINKAQDLNNYFSDYDCVYDGNNHSIILNIALTNATIKYSTDNVNYNLTEIPQFKDIGLYTVYYKITKDNFEDITGSNTVRIYGISNFAPTLELKELTLAIKDYNNSFTSICDRIGTFATNCTIYHYNKDNVLLNDNLTKTGDIIKININNQKEYTYTISILGDVSGDGKISALDYVKIKNHIMNTSKITDNAFLVSADVNNDGSISALDYVRVKNYIMKGNN